MADKLKHFLDQKAAEFNRPAFIEDDPIYVPHLFSKKQDIEIAGFFSSIFAWGIRKTIINKSVELMDLMDRAPHDFILNHRLSDLKRMLEFRHRTFNSTDLLYFISFLNFHYQQFNSLEQAFFDQRLFDLEASDAVENGLNHFRKYFFSLEHLPARTTKHIASPDRKSTCKRLNMFLRWMVRNDGQGVDFGIWKSIRPAQLVCPVDLHVARVARRFNMFGRKQIDWEAALEITAFLRQLDPEDPVRYDFALFGLGVLEKY